jgi:hypothetical protein
MYKHKIKFDSLWNASKFDGHYQWRDGNPLFNQSNENGTHMFYLTEFPLPGEQQQEITQFSGVQETVFNMSSDGKGRWWK